MEVATVTDEDIVEVVRRVAEDNGVDNSSIIIESSDHGTIEIYLQGNFNGANPGRIIVGTVIALADKGEDRLPVIRLM